MTTWGNQLKEVVSTGLRKTEQYDELHNSSHHRHRRFQRPDASLWRSLSGWNGFKHAVALLDPTVRFAYNLLTSTTVASAATPVLTESFRRAEILNTVAYFVVCLRDKGMEEAAKRLAIGSVLQRCFLCLLSSAKPHVEEKTTVRNSTNGLSVVAECHEKVVSSLWGDQSRKGVGMALVVLFQAIEEEDWAWSTKHMYNLKPWLIPLTGETLLHGLRKHSEEQAKLVVSPAMFLALLCILTCQHAASSSTLEQVILNSIFLYCTVNKHSKWRPTFSCKLSLRKTRCSVRISFATFDMIHIHNFTCYNEYLFYCPEVVYKLEIRQLVACEGAWDMQTSKLLEKYTQ